MPSFDIKTRVGGAPAVATLVACLALLGVALLASAAPKADMWSRWEKHGVDNQATIKHDDWASFLDTYLSSKDGINLLAYGKVTKEDRQLLDGYLGQLQSTAISDYSQPEQMAYWINLYNALTVQTILDHYPVDSITEIDTSDWFSKGPWGDKVAKVEGEGLTLNDIEHRILRPIWKDPRIHYSVNCASIGCPNLHTEPYTGENSEELLEKAAHDFVNHSRGARFEGDRLVVSNIFIWYQADFGDSAEGVVRHLKKYAEGDLAKGLESWSGSKIEGEYDWRLNEP